MVRSAADHVSQLPLPFICNYSGEHPHRS